MATYTALTVADSSITPSILDLDAVMVGANTAAADGFSFVNDGNTILIVKDTAGGDSVLFVGRADEHGRSETTANLTKVVAAADTALIGPFPKSLWDQTGADAGTVCFDFTGASAATTTIVAVRIT